MSKNLIVEIEALHDTLTGNYVLYTNEALSNFDSWITPYKKPAIMHHKDEDGKIVGRVLEAKKIPSTVKPGLNALWLKAKITDKETIEGIKNGTYLTTSVGSKGTHVECSICGHRIDSGYACQHKKGKKYKGQLCYWIVKEMTAKEISFVIVPSDKYSQITKFYDEDEVIAPKTEKGEAKMELQEALQKIEALEAEKATLIAEKEAALATSEQLKEQLTEEITLREGLETELNAIHLAEKHNTIDSILTLREKLGLRKIETSVFETKEDAYLKEALEDLQAELAFKESQEQEEVKEEQQEEQEEKIMQTLKESELKNTEVPLEKENHVQAGKSPKAIINDLLG